MPDHIILAFVKTILASGPLGLIAFLAGAAIYFRFRARPSDANANTKSLYRALMWISLVILTVFAIGLVTISTGALDKSFAVNGSVRCPGGGDLLGRERNRRSAQVSFSSPSGAEIIEYNVEQVARNDANHSIDTDTGESGRVTKVTVRFSCDPPNYLGAGGGWYDLVLRGKYRYLLLP